MKKLDYIQPEMEMLKFGVSDVLTTSGAASGYNPNAQEAGNGWIINNGNDRGFELY